MFEELELEDNYDAIEAAEDYLASEGLPLPQAVTTVFGHDAQEQLILSLYNQNKMPHGMAFTGLKGIGKSSFAYRLARFLFHDAGNSEDSLFGGGEDLKAANFSVPDDSDAAKKVASLGHPDLLIVEPPLDERTGAKKNNIPVESIREISKFMHSTAAMGGWRICIIDDADLMNQSAQNALLKILEEPPHKALIILIAHRMGHFLPTIKSRLRVFPFKPLSQDVIDDLLSRSGFSIENKALVHVMSEGSIGAALELAEQQDMDVLQMVFDGFDSTKTIDRLAVMKLADFLSLKKKDDSFPFFVLFVSKMASEMVRLKALQKGFSDSALFKALSTFKTLVVLEDYFVSQDLQVLVQNYDMLQRHFIEGQRAYLDRRHLVQDAFEILIGNKKDDR